MNLRSQVVLIVLATLAAVGAGFCTSKAAQLRKEAAWLLARGQAQAAEFTSSLDGAHVDGQLSSFDARRAALEKAFSWQRGQVLLGVLAFITGVAAWVMHLLRRLRAQLEDASEPLTSSELSAAGLSAGPGPAP